MEENARVDTISYISYYFHLIETWISYYAGYVYDQFRDFSLVIKIAALGLTFCVLFIMWTMMLLAVQSWKRRKETKVRKRLTEKYGQGITYILSNDSPINMTRRQVMEAVGVTESEVQSNTLLKEYLDKMTMARIIYKAVIAEDAALDRGDNLHVLLRLFGIQEFLEFVVNKDKLRLKTEAMHMLRAFKLPINPWIANQLMGSKKQRLHRLAMYASIMSGSNRDLEYFESEFFDENCCVYDEIQLGYVLQRRKSARRKIPNLAIMALKQSKPSTQCVFIRLMRQFNQKEYCSDLDELFQPNSDSNLIEEISRTWGYLQYTAGEELMNEVLLTQGDATKIAIMHALTRLGTGKSINALVDGYRNNGDPKVRYEALRCLWNYGELGRAKFRQLEREVQGEDAKLFEFFHNDLTKEEIELSKSDTYVQEFGDNIYSVV